MIAEVDSGGRVIKVHQSGGSVLDFFVGCNVLFNGTGHFDFLECLGNHGIGILKAKLFGECFFLNTAQLLLRVGFF